MTSSVAVGSAEGLSVKTSMSKEDRRRVVEKLKWRDNWTNFYYLAQVYAVLIATAVLTIWSYGLVADAGLSWWWNIPATIVAVIIMGGTQHQFGGVVHEGTHHILFKNRVLNEAVSDWLAAFPIFTTTYTFRLHHLAHHQFVNDPARDPNFEMAKDGGHWLDFPVEHMELLFGILRMIWFPNTFRYLMARLKQSSLGGSESHPYADRVRKGSSWPMRIGVIYTIVTPFLIFPFQLQKMYLAAGLVLVGLTAACVIYYLLTPDSGFQQSRLNPTISHRVTQISRTIYMGIVYGLLTFAEFATGQPTWIYFLVLWILPLFTTFPAFMVLREWLQHGNADRGRYTNSRIMLFNPLLRYAVMPWGMDYHLPHHIVATVPHYNIRKLHDFLLKTDAKYADNVQVVNGWSHHDKSGNPTIVDVLGPEYEPHSEDIHIASEALEYSEINDPKGIAEEEEASRHNH